MKLFNNLGKLSLLIAATTSLSVGSLVAVVPTGTPTFGSSLNINSTYSPFQPGGVKVFQGNHERRRAVVVHQYVFETRAFSFNGTNVECRILREMYFENGQLAKLTDNYLAQATDANVYSFGKSIVAFTNGSVLDHAGSWLVGGPTSEDSTETLTAAQPMLVMLANPSVGDTFKTEDLPPQLNTTARVLTTDVAIGTGVGRFTNVVRLVERTPRRPDTILGYARDVGLISKKNSRESWRLISSTLTGTNLVIPTNFVSGGSEISTNVPSGTNAAPELPSSPVDPTNPETPNIPGVPTNPTTPVDPSVPPIVPNDPLTPPAPVVPNEPTFPDTPTSPTEPANPGEPTFPSDPAPPINPNPTVPADPALPPLPF